jgi:hypothetical protein
MASRRQNSRSCAQKSSKGRRKKPVLAKKRAVYHPATQKAFIRLSDVEEVVNSQGRGRPGRPGFDKKSTPRCRQSREIARKFKITAQRHAMKRASADHRKKCPVAPGCAEAFAKAQKGRESHKLSPLHAFLMKKTVAERIVDIENVSCWYFPHGKLKCDKIPKGFIIKVEAKRRQPTVLKHASEAWVTLYCADDVKKVYCADARHVFVTKGSLARRSMVGKRAKHEVQRTRVARKEKRHTKKPRKIQTR